MRRVLLCALAAVVVGLAGCGSSHPGGPTGTPLQRTLAYFPPESPMVVVYDTRPDPQAAARMRQLERRDPLLGFARAGLLSRIQQQFGIDYDKQVKPLLGNPIIFGDSGTTFQELRGHVLAAWEAKSASGLHSLVRKLHLLTRSGTRDGATLYSDPHGLAVALRGPTVLLGSSSAVLQQALDRAAQGAGITAADYSADISGLAPDSQLYAFGRLGAALSGPRAVRARQVPWVAALRGYGVSITSASTGASLRFHLDTTGTSLSASQLPLAAGGAAPGLVSGLPIQAAIRDPSQIVQFVLAAQRAVSPNAYARFLRQQPQLRRRTGIDFSSLAARFSGDLVLDSDSKVSLVRAGVSDPTTVTNDLVKLSSAASAVTGRLRLRPIGGGFYRVLHARRSDVLGVVGDQLVFGEAPLGTRVAPSVLERFAKAPAQPLPGAAGALDFRIQLGQLLALTRPGLTSNPQAHDLIALLGDITGSMQATPSALSGTASFALR